MSLLEILKKQLLGTTNTNENTENGILNLNKNDNLGLLGNINPAILGSAIYGQGIKGKDPFESLFPATMQTAQLQKLLTPTKGKLVKAKNRTTGKEGFVDSNVIRANPDNFDLIKTKMFETAEEKKVGESFGVEFSTLNTNSQKATENNNNLEVMETLVNLPNIQTGFAGQLRTEVASLAREFGIDTDIQDLTAAEALKSVSGQIVLDGLSKFKGAISDGERRFLVSITPGLTNSIEGNKLLINVGKRQNQLAIGLAEEANKWFAENGGLSKKNSQGMKWNQYKLDWQKQNPVLNPELKDNILKLSKKIDPDFNNNIISKDGKKYIKIGNDFYLLEN